jgi:hypothetical protein
VRSTRAPGFARFVLWPFATSKSDSQAVLKLATNSPAGEPNTYELGPRAARRLLIVYSNKFRIRVQIPHGLLRGFRADRRRAAVARETTVSKLGRRIPVRAPMLMEKRAGRTRPGVKDLRSITDPADGSEARRPEIARTMSGLSR